MEPETILRAVRCKNVKRLAFWAVLVLLMVGTLAVVPDDAEAQGPGRKDITFYFHNVTSGKQVGSISTMRIMNTTVGSTLNTSVRSAKAIQYDFYLYPVLANDTAVEGNVTVNIWARRIATSGDNRGAALIFYLYDYDSTGTQVAAIASRTLNINMITAWTEYQIGASNVPRYNVSAGHTLRMYVEIDGSSSNDYQMAWGDASRRSRAVIEMHEYVRVDSAQTLDHLRVPTIVFSQLVANKTIIFNANVTDPYGGYDVKWVNATVVAPNGTTVLDEVLMTRTKGFYNTFYNEYEYSWNYTGYPTGQYNLTVDVVDWAGYYHRFPTNPGDSTYGGHLESLTVSFWIGGMPHDIDITVSDNGGSALGGAEVVLGPAHGLTDASGALTLKVANGSYMLDVFWQRVLVYSNPVAISGDATLSVRVAVFSPQIIILDDLGASVKDAVVFLDHPNGSRLKAFWRTDDNGSIWLDRMAGGDYGFSVLWQGVEVHNASVTVDSEGPISITVQVYTLDVLVLDEAGDGLELAQVVVTHHRTGIVADSKLTNLTGVAVSRLPVGSYDFVVYWRNVNVFDSLVDHRVDYSGQLVLRARIHAVNLTVVDSMDAPLAAARVVVGFAVSSQVHDFGTTDDGGVLVTKLPLGYYDIWVYWKDILVNTTEDLWIDASGNHTIVADVFWVDMTVVDSRDVPVRAAIVTVRHEGGQDFGTTGTDDLGGVSYRLPGGLFDVDVTWLESRVYHGLEAIASNDPLVLRALIYYLDLTVVDTLAAPLDGALVTVGNATTLRGMGSHSTDASGNATYRLPVGDYDLAVLWQETVVYVGQRRMDANIQEVITASVYYLDLNIVDSRDAPVAGAQVTVTNGTSGRIMGSPTTDNAGNVTLRIPVGTYDVRVVWQDTVVHEGTRRVDTNVPATIVAAVFYVDMHVEDTLGVNLEGALVTFNNASNGRSMGTQATGAHGNCSYRVPVGTYDLVLTWQEEVVHSSQEVVDTDRVLTIVGSVYYAIFETVDSTGVPIAGAQVTVTNPDSGRIMGSLTTDASGIVTFRVPKGDYDVEAIWQESVVYKAIRTVDSNDATVLSASVFYADLHVVDSMDVSIAAALVSLTNTSSGRAMGDLATDDDGHVTFRLPMGVYTVEVLWADMMVFDDLIDVDTNGLHLIVADVYYPGYDIADSRDKPLVGALVTLARTFDGRIVASHLTDAAGATTFRVPKGNYHVTVVWLDTLVHDGNYDVVSNDRFPVEARVHYAMFVAVDSLGIGLENAQVVVENSTTDRSMGALTADGSGRAEFRLPEGDYRVEVIWQHAIVYLGTWFVDDDATITLPGWVYYVTFHVTDGSGVDLEDARVGLVNDTAGTTLGTLTTDADGEVEFRLPLGDAALTVTWRTVLVHEDPAVPITRDEVVEISAMVYYLEVRVIGSDGSKVERANVDVVRDRLAVASDLTHADGSAMFRLPVGQYVVNMTFSTTQHLTSIDVKRSEDVDLSQDALVRFKLTGDEYPLPFLKTNLFWIILLFVLLIILVLFLVYRVSKAAKAVPGDDAEEPLEYDESDLDDLLEDLEGDEAGDAAAGVALLSSDEDDSDFEELPPEDEEKEFVGEEADDEGEDAFDRLDEGGGPEGLPEEEEE